MHSSSQKRHCESSLLFEELWGMSSPHLTPSDYFRMLLCDTHTEVFWERQFPHVGKCPNSGSALGTLTALHLAVTSGSSEVGWQALTLVMASIHWPDEMSSCPSPQVDTQCEPNRLCKMVSSLHSSRTTHLQSTRLLSRGRLFLGALATKLKTTC